MLFNRSMGDENKEQLTNTLLECLLSQNEGVRLNGVLHFMWQVESAARSHLLALAQLGKVLHKGGESEDAMNVAALLTQTENLLVYVRAECAALVPHVQSLQQQGPDGTPGETSAVH